MITMFFKQRVSLRVEPGISFLYIKYLGDEAIIAGNFVKKREMFFIRSLTSK